MNMYVLKYMCECVLKLSSHSAIKKIGHQQGTIASKINVTPKGVRLSEKLQLIAALCDKI